MANGHGGRRPGAGKKPGVAAQKTIEVANQAAAEGISPLRVMLKCMMAHLDAGRLDQAADRAKDAAPYMHHRLSSIDMNASVSVAQEVVEELRDASDPPPDNPAVQETTTLPPE